MGKSGKYFSHSSHNKTVIITEFCKAAPSKLLYFQGMGKSCPSRFCFPDVSNFPLTLSDSGWSFSNQPLKYSSCPSNQGNFRGPWGYSCSSCFFQLPENQDLRFIIYWSSLTSSAQRKLTLRGIPESTTTLNAIEMQIQLSYD